MIFNSLLNKRLLFIFNQKSMFEKWILLKIVQKFHFYSFR